MQRFFRLRLLCADQSDRIPYSAFRIPHSAFRIPHSTGLRLLLAVFFALFYALPTGFAQLSNHGLLWHFGNHAGLDFTSGVPVKITNSAMDSYEGCSSYCDANGQLLFYSNGGGSLENGVNGLRTGAIWNRNNAVMYNMGQTEGGGYSSAQGVVVLPKPGSPGRYYQFTVDHNASVGTSPLGTHRGLSYFEIDMTLNNGLGDVVQTNVPVHKPAVEALTAVPQANGQDFWVITIDYNSQDFLIVPVTAGGIGQPQIQPRLASDSGAVVIKMSPDGHFLCTDSELYAFNAADGTLQFLKTLGISTYTFSFSPNSRYLYGYDSDSVIVDMVRYDLLVPAATKLTLTTAPVFTFGGLMQLGPDGNIYMIEQGEEDFLSPTPSVSLSVVRCPDGAMPQLERVVMQFPTDLSNGGGLFTSLPNFADYIFAADATPQDTLERSICLNSIVLQPEEAGTDYQWSTGDTTAQITVTVPGVYSVAVPGPCGPSTTIFQVRPGGAEVNISSAAIADSCRAFPLTLQAMSSQAGTFQWSNGSIADSLVITDFGTYVVRLTTDCGVATDTFRLVQPLQDCCRPLFPNAFTPNNDGINDRFSAIFEQCDLAFADFFIYDRWGELIFQSYEPTEQWDGLTLNGTVAVSDVYIYTLRYKRRDQSQEQFEKGQVTLLR